MSRLNLIGQAIARLRSQRGWTQKTLMAKLQCQGVDITRDVLANIESGRTKVTDEHIIGCHHVFRVRLVLLFPKAVQDFEQELVKREKILNAQAAAMQRRKP